MPIRVASYNIRKSVGRDYRRDPKRVLGILARMKADVVAIQEADRRFGTRETSIPRDLFSKPSDFRLVELSIRPASIGWHGNAVLLRRDIELLDHNKLDLPGFEPRGAVAVDLSRNGKAMRVVGVHLGLLKRNRRKQVAEITRYLRGLSPLPTVILGDFNEWSPTGRNLLALDDEYYVHTPGHSFPSGRPIAGLDKIAVSRGIKLLKSGVHNCKSAKVASDHLPIWADIVAA